VVAALLGVGHARSPMDEGFTGATFVVGEESGVLIVRVVLPV
jgi:hypothetical protein